MIGESTKDRQGFVLFRQNCLTGLNWPMDAQLWIQPVNPAVMGGRIDGVDFIKNLCVLYISGGLGELVGPSVDDGMAIDVVDTGHDALLEFVL